MGFRLIIKSGKGIGKEFSFVQERVRVGRLPENDLVLYDTGVSRVHCEISQENEFYMLRDAGSANGTSLNNEVVTEAQLQSGDRIQIGPVEFAFLKSDTQPQIETQEAIDTEPSGGAIFKPERETAQRRLEQLKTSELKTSELNEAIRKYGGVKAKFNSLSKIQKIGLIGIPVLLAITVLFGQDKKKDRSAEIFELTKIKPSQRFGDGKVDVYTPHAATFSFDYKEGQATFYYAAGSIDRPNEAEIFLNDKSVGFLATAKGRWQRDLQIILPTEHLKQGKNILSIQHRSENKKDTWGIAQLAIKTRKLAPLNPARAQELYDLAKSTFETRSVAPQNLYRSIQYLKEARTHLEAAQSKPGLWDKINNLLEEAQNQLQNTYDNLIFSAERALRFDKLQEAGEILRECLDYFPNQDDKRHQEVKNRLNRLRSR